MSIATRLILLCWLGCSLPVTAEIPTVKAETFADTPFTFPADISGARYYLVMLAMADSQENGQLQQEELLAWHQAIIETLPEGVEIYHFPVMESPPFFVKGIIRRAMRKSYEGQVDLNKVAILFIKDLQGFAAGVGVVADGQSSVLLLDAEHQPLLTLKGPVDDAKLSALQSALNTR